MNSKTIKKKVLNLLGYNFAVPLVNVLCNTLRIKENDSTGFEEVLAKEKGVIFAFWHGTMLTPWYLLKKYSPSTIVSKSKDGEILVKLLNKWRYDVKRGSSSKGGKEVLEDLIEIAKNNNSIAITPDGPRGPNKVMKAGAVIIAKKTKKPIVLVGACSKKKIKLNSWDKFEIPLFFSKINVVYSEPIYIDADLSFDETNNKINELTNRLNQIQNLAEKNC